MIRRDDGDDWLLMSQVDHAHLASEIAAVWGNDVVASLPVPDLLVPAIRDHDEGWRDWEQTPAIDPETGKPRDFTAMPMRIATAIWSKSIEACGREMPSHAVHPNMSAFADILGKFLSQKGMRLTHERRIIIAEVFSSNEPFDVDSLVDRLKRRDDGRRVSRTTVYRTLVRLIDAGLLEKTALTDERNIYELTPLRPVTSRLGGIWVSRHFWWLAAKARESRQENAEDTAAIEGFLDAQLKLQAEWREEARDQFDEHDFNYLSEIGFRYVQFFDLFSLWLCCAQHTQTYEMEVPGNGPIHLTPLSSHEIAADPFPLSVDRLELTVPARRIPIRRNADDAELHAALQNAPTERVSWTIVRW